MKHEYFVGLAGSTHGYTLQGVEDLAISGLTVLFVLGLAGFIAYLAIWRR